MTDAELWWCRPHRSSSTTASARCCATSTQPHTGRDNREGRGRHDDSAAGRASVTVATYPDYPAAQRAVDYLSDQSFPVEHTAIVGTDLRLVENVLGRLTIGRAALAGAGGGAWFGLFIGLLFGDLQRRTTGSPWSSPASSSARSGARSSVPSRTRRLAAGATSRRVSSLQAREYAVSVDAEHAEPARQLLTRLTWQASQTR